jgi:hypothetical protein
LSKAAKSEKFEGEVPGPEEYKFRLFIEMEVSFDYLLGTKLNV